MAIQQHVKSLWCMLPSWLILCIAHREATADYAAVESENNVSASSFISASKGGESMCEAGTTVWLLFDEDRRGASFNTLTLDAGIKNKFLKGDGIALSRALECSVQAGSGILCGSCKDNDPKIECSRANHLLKTGNDKINHFLADACKPCPGEGLGFLLYHRTAEDLSPGSPRILIGSDMENFEAGKKFQYNQGPFGGVAKGTYKTTMYGRGQLTFESYNVHFTFNRLNKISLPSSETAYAVGAAGSQEAATLADIFPAPFHAFLAYATKPGYFDDYYSEKIKGYTYSNSAMEKIEHIIKNLGMKC